MFSAAVNWMEACAGCWVLGRKGRETQVPAFEMFFRIECKTGIKVSSFFMKKNKQSQLPWLTPVIPALWEAETGGSRDQEFETSLVNTVKPHLY